jgi:hypothetical protein
MFGSSTDRSARSSRPGQHFAPRSILVFGVANTILGFLGFCSGLKAFLRPQQTVAMQVYQQVDLPSQSMQWLHFAMIMSPISFAIMLICGVGLLQRRPWGRKLAIYYGLGSSLVYLIASSINIVRILDKANNPIVLNIIFSIAIGSLLGIAYRLAMVYYLTRPTVKTALATQPIAEILEFKPRSTRRPRR